MKAKWIFGIGIVAAVIASLYYIVKLNLSYSVLSMMALFALTNGARSRTFHEQGMERESKWMLWMSLFFGIGFVVSLILILSK
ncbi:hypothetical protein [Sporosarcina sp. G11-34]|uniref:hypothetical protein n=1 Tax=Sporosarcina sp. G11-34 TaxID=2849605 RepID=UPI0022A978D8|nr:hypothetical protein [Sporosarcina sp. G11-34]MCZ2260402.1 hypothetical protein [Sporosarcina sp. G11-34]